MPFCLRYETVIDYSGLNFYFFSLQFNMDRANAEEFFEVYKGVVTEYTVSIESDGGRKKKRRAVFGVCCFLQYCKYHSHMLAGSKGMHHKGQKLPSLQHVFPVKQTLIIILQTCGERQWETREE